MGFRAAFLKHEGFTACHSEVFLHVMDRLTAGPVMSVLMVGVDNGGSLQVWREALAEGSSVMALDERPECADLGLDVHVGRTSDRAWLESTLGSLQFDLIIDSMGHANGDVWPWLKVGGFLAIEKYDDSRVRELMTAMIHDQDSWLPYDEVLGVQYYPNVVFVEKRNPRVVPYLNIIVGNEAPVVDEDVYVQRGGKRITVSKEVLENL
jgi:hypothetical protein